jgi:hypothetical protein
VFLGPVDLMLKKCAARYLRRKGAERDALRLAGQTSAERKPLTPCEFRHVTDARIKARMLMSMRAWAVKRGLAGCQLARRVGNGAHCRSISKALKLRGGGIRSDGATRAGINEEKCA